MIKKNAIRFGRMLLMFGIGLCSIVVLEAHHDMVRAVESSPIASIVHQSRAAETTQVAANSPRVPAAPAANVQQPKPQSEPQPKQQSQSEPQSEPQSEQGAIAIAVDSQAGSQPVQQADPDLVAVRAWQGASFPVEGFQAYTSPFGYRRSATGGYSQEFHYGLDMAAPEGSYIRNWWTGMVVEVSDNSNCGTSVVVESGNWLHIYCHMQGHVETANGKRYMIDRSGGVQIWEGQEINAGERLGRVGMTGRTTGPHLHWGLKYDNNWVDPALVLRAMYSSQRNASLPRN